MAHLDEIRGLAEYHATRISSSPRDWMKDVYKRQAFTTPVYTGNDFDY